VLYCAWLQVSGHAAPDLASAVERGRIPGAIIGRLASLEESRVLAYLLRFGGFRERLLADDLFLTKVAIECGVRHLHQRLRPDLPSSSGSAFPPRYGPFAMECPGQLLHQGTVPTRPHAQS